MVSWTWLVLWAAAGQTASPPDPPPPACQEPTRRCRPVAVARTILVPRISYQQTKVPVIALQPQVKEKTITALRFVPEQRTVTRLVPVIVPEEETVTETYTECRLVEEEVIQEVVVWQPHSEVQEGTRTTSRPVLTEETRTISKDVGGWREKRWVDAHGCQRRCRVWAPKIVTEQIRVTVPKLEAIETPYREEAVVYSPETRTVTQRVCKPVYETKTREVTRTVCVEKLVEREFTEVAWRRVAEEQVVNYLVPEVVAEERELLTATRELIPKRVMCIIGGCER